MALPNSPIMPVMGSTGAMSPPTPNAGAMADSISKVGIAVQMLQEALPGLPIGDEMQKTVLDAITKLSKMAPPSAQVPGVQATQLSGLQDQAKNSAMLQALSRAIGAAGPAPGGAPPSPGPGMDAGPMM